MAVAMMPAAMAFTRTPSAAVTLLVGAVERKPARRAGCLDEALRHGVGGLDGGIGHDHPRAGIGRAAGDGGAVAAAGAGAESQAAGEKVFQHTALIAGSIN